MTEKEKANKVIEKVQKKNPDIVNPNELLELAIKEAKKDTLLKAIGWLLGGILSLIVCSFIYSRNSESSTGMLFMIMGGSFVVESIRKFASLPKVSNTYKPVVVIRDEGCLTKEKILNDAGRKLRKEDGRFIIIQESLFDKEDEFDTGTDNEVTHTYKLIFTLDGSHREIKVKKSVFDESVIGVRYYLVLSSDAQTLFKAYPCTNWKLDDELLAYCQGTLDDQLFDHTAEISSVVKKEKPKKLLPILALSFSIAALLLPFILALPLAIAAVVLAIISIVKSRNGWTISSTIVSILVTVLLRLFFFSMI